MTPEEILRTRVLSEAAATIGDMPEDQIRAKYAQMQQARKDRSEREAARQKAAVNAVHSDEAAYRLGLMYEESDPVEAEEWYRAAAANDFPGASLKLAKILAARAADHHAGGETQAEESLIEEAQEWCMKAVAAGEFIAGEIEPFDLTEQLNSQLDRLRAGRPRDDDPRGPATSQCAGRRQAALLADPVKLAEHLASCEACLAEKAASEQTRAFR
jgi:hypothetical protein